MNNNIGNTPKQLTAEEILRQNKYDSLKGLTIICEAMEEYTSLKLQELEKESELFEKSSIRWESKFEAKVIELQQAKEKEILGDRKIVQLEHEKVVLKAELQQANKEIERSIDIMENGNKIINELETKIKHKDKMLEKMAELLADINQHCPLGLSREFKAKELLTQYKQGK